MQKTNDLTMNDYATPTRQAFVAKASPFMNKVERRIYRLHYFIALVFGSPMPHERRKVGAK